MAKKRAAIKCPLDSSLTQTRAALLRGLSSAAGRAESGAGWGSAEAPPARTLEPRPAEPVKTVLIEPLDLQDEE